MGYKASDELIEATAAAERALGERKRASHWIAMSGLHGCLPDFCTAASTKEAAYETLHQLHDFSNLQRAFLLNDGLTALDEQDGCFYAEIRECNCADPSVHCDDDQFEGEGE